jgi:putative membrane protein
MMWGNGCWQGWGAGMGIGGMFMMLVFWALIIGGIILLFAWLVRCKKREFPGSGETPLDILKKRYARGEVSKDEFDRMKKDLES